MRKAILIIDMQNDFVKKDGALSVPNAETALSNLVSFLNEHVDELDGIYFSKDFHPRENISNSNFWYNDKFEHVAPNTVITHQDILDKKYMAHYFKKYILDYTEEIEAKGKVLIAWNPHCIQGTVGCEVCIELVGIAKQHRDKVHFIIKGTNPYTEHYSIFKAEVPDPKDIDTQLNKNLLDELNSYDEIYVCGVATDYCVKESVRDIMENNGTLYNKLTLLPSCMASIDENFSIKDDEVFGKLPTT